MNKKYFIGLFLMSALLFTGCTKENTEDCFSGLRLSFNFTLNTDDRNLFGEKVHRVRVYLFDENEVLQLYALDNGEKLEYSYLQQGQIKTVSNPNTQGGMPDNYIMNLDKVPPGKYKIMSWAGSGLKDNTTFFHGHLDTSISDNITEDVTLGITTMEDFRMLMKHKTVSGIPEDIEPEVDEIDDLWYGTVGYRHPKSDIYTFEEVEVKNAVITERNIELIRNTNILKVTVSGIENLIPRMLDIEYKLWVVASNGEYKFNNTIGLYAKSIRYTPFRSSNKERNILADIKILRLDMERHQAEPVLLYIEAPDGRRFPSQPIDVVNTLLQARNPATGEYIYNSQSDFDRIYEHPIEVRIGYNLEVRIFIGEWEIVNVKPA